MSSRAITSDSHTVAQQAPATPLDDMASIVATYFVLRWTQRNALTQRLAKDVPVPRLSRAGKMAAFGIATWRAKDRSIAHVTPWHLRVARPPPQNKEILA